MAKLLHAVQVFIASPGGLADERRAFKEVIERVNHDHAHEVGITFVPKGWEYVSSGIGRPQEKINEQVRESDYLVVILWDKWGRPPGNGDFTSGTEEEYRVGLDCLSSKEYPMRDIVVLFKGVNERQLADPGDDLKKVLQFRTELEESRILLYSTFDTIDEFRDDFRNHLHNWIRDWQGHEPPEKKTPPSPEPPARQSNVDGQANPDSEQALSLAQRAKAAVDRGRFTAAEQLFAKGTTGVYDRDSFTEYVRFLRKTGRLSLAQTSAERFLGLAQDADDYVGEVEALANLAIIERQRGGNRASLEYIGRALSVVEELISSCDPSDSESYKAALGTKAFLLDNKSLTLRRLPDKTDEALRALDDARKVQTHIGDTRGTGFTLRNQGTLLLRTGRLNEAESVLREALAVFEDAGYANGQATALGGLGEVYEAMGDYDRAIEMLDRSIAVSPTRTPGRVAVNYGILARLHTERGDFDQARHFAEYCLRAAQDLGTTESLATALHVTGMISAAEGKQDVAFQELTEALELFEKIGNPVGVAAVHISLARQYLKTRNGQAFNASIAAAKSRLAHAPHYLLQKELEVLEEQAGADDQAPASRQDAAR